MTTAMKWQFSEDPTKEEGGSEDCSTRGNKGKKEKGKKNQRRRRKEKERRLFSMGAQMWQPRWCQGSGGSKRRRVAVARRRFNGGSDGLRHKVVEERRKFRTNYCLWLNQKDKKMKRMRGVMGKMVHQGKKLSRYNESLLMEIMEKKGRWRRQWTKKGIMLK